jgi:hypothetical protein
LTAIAPAIESGSTLADRQAASNWAANVVALRTAQPGLVESLPELPDGLTFIFGRDGALTAINGDGSWWQGCSLPRRAAKAILKSLDSVGRVSCYLSPTHAAQIRVALDKLPPEQAIVALCPDALLLAVMLYCEDFSSDISAHRLYFAWGTGWQQELRRVFEKHPGLPTPEQFIRGAAADHAETSELIPLAEKVFAAQTAQRSARIKALYESWSAPARTRPRICLIAPSHFQLWEDGGQVLVDRLASVNGTQCEVVRFDNDDPASAAPVALAELATECDAVVSLNIARADLPEILSPQMPWITWLVQEQIPSGTSAGPHDALLVADARARSEAIGKGWPADRIETACWPAREAHVPPGSASLLAMIVDTRSIEAPARIADMSSQRLLWDAIAAEIAADPFVATPDPAKYLRRRQRDMQIPEEGFDASLFLNLLIAPAFAQSLARLLLREKLPICLAGAGWDSMAEFAEVHAGPIKSRAALAEVIQSSQALVYGWPMPRAHPINSLRRPMLRPAAGRSQFLSSAKLAIQGKLQPPPTAESELTAEMILRVLRK